MKRQTFLLLTSLSVIGTASAQKQLHLNEADLTKAAQSYAAVEKNLSVTGLPIQVNGKRYAEGIGVHAPSLMKLNLKGKATRLTAMVAVTDARKETNTTSIPLADGKRIFYTEQDGKKFFVGVEGDNGKVNAGTIRFKVIGDGKEIYASPVMKQGKNPHKIDISLKGIQLLELVAEDASDGVSGDAGVWIAPVITYNEEQPVMVASNYVAPTIIDEAQNKALMAKSSKLKAVSLPLQRPGFDWLIDNGAVKAEICQSNDGKNLILTNGLTSRIFRISPSLATIDWVNQMSGENLLRAASSEGEITIDGKTYPLGGIDGQFEFGYLQYKWLENLPPMPNSFQVKDFRIQDLQPRIRWAKSRWAGNKQSPTGKELIFTLTHPSEELKGISIDLHYAIYDGIPAISKWMDVRNESGRAITIDSFKLEQLAMAEPNSPVELQDSKDPRFLKPNVHIESDWAFRGFTEPEADVTEHWETDPRYTSQCNYPLVTPCMLEVKLPMGPDATVSSNDSFHSFRVWEMPFDSYDKERKGRFIRQMYRTISPWLTENPIFMHCTSSDPKVVKEAIDQCAETGYEMVILSFGSGLNMEDESPENYQKFKELNDYANSKGIALGGYSLLSSRWISDEVDVINPKTGKRGGMIFGSSPCLSSDWGYDYFRKIKTFYEKTGMKVFENDGSYPGNVCASTSHAHHKGLKDSQWEQRKQIAALYQWMCENGVYTNIPDFGYMHNGGTKVGIGYREVNWSLPRERQLILGRQINYDGTWERLGSMCWTFVPLTQYHGGGAAATLEPLSEHLKEYEGHMMQNYGAGIQACYRGHRLYDTEETKNVVKKVIAWYKQYRDILNSDLIHLRRADGRDYDGFMHVNPKLKEKAMVMLFNPLDESIEREITLPLYDTGKKDAVRIREQENAPKDYQLDRDYKVRVNVTIPAKGYTWLVVE